MKKVLKYRIVIEAEFTVPVPEQAGVEMPDPGPINEAEAKALGDIHREQLRHLFDRPGVRMIAINTHDGRVEEEEE